MPIVLPQLPEPSPAETGPFVVIARHRALPGRADAYEQRMLADLERTRAEPGALQFHIHRDPFDPQVFVILKQFVADSSNYVDGNMVVQWLVMASEYVGK